MASASPATDRPDFITGKVNEFDWEKQMFKHCLIACMAFWVIGANAAPIVYTSTQYDTVAAASAGTAADFNFASSPTAAIPLIASATAWDGTEFASGSGIAANGLLTTQAEASSAAGVANAVGTAEFLGAFFLDTSLHLSIDMTNLDIADAAAFSGGTLFVLVTVDGTTYLDEQLFAEGLYTYRVGPATGGNYSLSLLLSSEASTSIGGDAYNFASVTFGVSPVPEPGTLLLGGIGLIGIWSQRRASVRGKRVRNALS